MPSLPFRLMTRVSRGQRSERLACWPVFLPKIPEILQGILWQSVYISESKEGVFFLVAKDKCLLTNRQPIGIWILTAYCRKIFRKKEGEVGELVRGVHRLSAGLMGGRQQKSLPDTLLGRLLQTGCFHGDRRRRRGHTTPSRRTCGCTCEDFTCRTVKEPTWAKSVLLIIRITSGEAGMHCWG